MFALLALVISAGPAPKPMTIGETVTLTSKTLGGEKRRINLYRPPVDPKLALPVLLMLDGGLEEDFVHVAGLVQIGASNGTMRPFLLVGIENTERRRDLTGPTTNEEDKKVAPRVGGSEKFRAFIADELLPWVEANQKVTKERAIVGESFAGLFVIETFVERPDLFTHYVAIDPSLWWNDGKLLPRVEPMLHGADGKTLFVAASNEPDLSAPIATLEGTLKTRAPATLTWRVQKFPNETHATVFHPAALLGFRAQLGKP
ncbi:MAG: alpha/beta hydrolase-fold protein [Archangium sp.]